MKRQKIPVEWITIHFKEYPRLDRIILPKNFSTSKMKLETAIKKRRSRRMFSGKSLTLGKLSKLLYYSCGITRRNKDLNKTRRAYPSGGARYPLEVYVMILRKGELKPGIYHYNVKHHVLETIILGNFEKYFNFLYELDMIKEFSAVLIITCIPARTAIKYTTQWDRFILLEAGHLGQNVYLVSEAMGLGCCGIGSWDDMNMNKFIDIDGKYEYIVHMVALGKRN